MPESRVVYFNGYPEVRESAEAVEWLNPSMAESGSLSRSELNRRVGKEIEKSLKLYFHR